MCPMHLLKNVCIDLLIHNTKPWCSSNFCRTSPLTLPVFKGVLSNQFQSINHLCSELLLEHNKSLFNFLNLSTL